MSPIKATFFYPFFCTVSIMVFSQTCPVGFPGDRLHVLGVCKMSEICSERKINDSREDYGIPSSQRAVTQKWPQSPAGTGTLSTLLECLVKYPACQKCFWNLKLFQFHILLYGRHIHLLTNQSDCLHILLLMKEAKMKGCEEVVIQAVLNLVLEGNVLIR